MQTDWYRDEKHQGSKFILSKKKINALKMYIKINELSFSFCRWATVKNKLRIINLQLIFVRIISQKMKNFVYRAIFSSLLPKPNNEAVCGCVHFFPTSSNTHQFWVMYT
jgi:hypothetical protein